MITDMYDHEWENVNSPADPLYQCRFCRKYETKERGPTACRAAEAHYTALERNARSTELAEYERLKAEQGRYQELHAKYGGQG